MKRIHAAALLAVALAADALAQSYPARPVRIFVTSGPGSAPDVRARQIASDGLHPDSDQHASADFRRHLARVVARRALADALSRARKEEDA